MYGEFSLLLGKWSSVAGKKRVVTEWNQSFATRFHHLERGGGLEHRSRRGVEAACLNSHRRRSVGGKRGVVT